MNKYISFIISLAVLLGAFSCSDHRLDDITPAKVLIPQSGEVDLLIYKTGEPMVFQLGVYKTGVGETAADVQLKVMSDVELDVYNSNANTDYKRLPDNCFSLNSQSVSFSSESRLEYVGISINYDIIEQLPDFDDQNSVGYVIPVIISGSTIDISEDNSLTFIKPILKDPLIYFTSLSSKVTIDAASASEDQVKIELGVDFTNEWDISVDLQIDSELVDLYNEENNVSLSLLSADNYTIAPTPVVIKNGEKSAEVVITLASDQIDYDDFLLPISIRSTSKFEADLTSNVYYLTVSKPANRFDRTGWTIAGFSTEEAGGEGPVNGYAKTVLDGDPATFWHSQWGGGTGQLPHYITIDMQKELLVTSVDLQRRTNNSDTHKGKFHISSDNVDFTEIGSFEMALVNDAQTFKVTTTRGRYLKVEITDSRRAPFANMSEIYVRGVE